MDVLAPSSVLIRPKKLKLFPETGVEVFGQRQAGHWPTALRKCAGYPVATALCLLCLVWALKLWEADLRVPLIGYNADNRFTGMWIKSILDNGWYLHNDRVGAPYGLDMHDFPLTENFHFLAIKALGLLSSDAGIVQNLYFLLTFPLTTLTFLFVMRQLYLSFPPAIVGSLLYAFLYYHFARGTGHLFLAAYYLVPLQVVTAIWLYQGSALWRKGADIPATDRMDWWSVRSVGSVVIYLLAASSGVYYAYFGCFFLLVAGFAAFACRRTVAPLLAMTCLLGISAFGVVANISPSLIYQVKNGANTEIVDRPPGAAEIYGLKLAQLMLPQTHHRLPQLVKVKAIYNSNPTPLVNENDTASLGIAGAGGFLLLTGGLLLRRLGNGPLAFLGICNLSGFLLATVGGFGAILSLLGLRWIRCYNRISIFLAFFALAAVVIALDQLHRRSLQSRRGRAASLALLTLIGIAGLWDQTSEFFVLARAAATEEFHSDAAFVRQIETLLPEGSMVYQLPYVPFPEATGLGQMADYDLFRGYLHSNKLRWSYGCMKGREGDCWQQHVAAQEPAKMVETLAFAGFSGIYLDRYGFADHGAGLEKALTRLLASPVLVSGDQRLVFFDLRPFAEQLHRDYTNKDWALKKDQAVHPLLLLWKGGFSGDEGSGEHRWRWCSFRGELHIVNLSTRPKTIALAGEIGTNQPRLAHVDIVGPCGVKHLAINGATQPWKETLTLAPGTHVIRFASDGPRLPVPGDPRELVFHVANFAFREVDTDTDDGGPVGQRQKCAAGSSEEGVRR
jgi:phosphoglycerol transferase